MKIAKALGILALVLIGVTLLYGCYWVIAWEGGAVIIVEDRWWVAHTYVQYTDTDVTTSVDADGNVTITTSTSTVTRCRNEAKGRDLPVVHPPPGCVQRPGDYISQGQWFYIKYHEQESETSSTKGFMPTFWERLEPGLEAKVKWNVLRFIKEVDDED